MAHLLQHKCYIHCVFLVKKTEISNSCCKWGGGVVLLFFLCIDHTLLFQTNFIIRCWKVQNKMEIALLENWSL